MVKPSDLNDRINNTLQDATDLSQGAAAAAFRLQMDVNQSRSQLSAKDYQTYVNEVASSLKDSGSMGALSVAWLHDNAPRYDINNDKRIDKREINAAISNSQDALEQALLVGARDQYQSIKHAGGEGFLGIRRDSLSHHDFDQFSTKGDAQRDRAAAAFEQNAARQTNSQQVMEPLLANSAGDKEHSLFYVLDNIKGGSPDGKISKGDLKSFIKQYDRAALNGGDVDQGAFTRENRDYVQRLLDNWDKSEVVDLRGTHKEGAQAVPNSYITEKSLMAASGMDVGTGDFYRSFQRVNEPADQPLPPAPEIVEKVKEPAADCVTKAPEVDLQAQRADFERQLRQHIDQEAHYTVKPGQGFDRIARDVIRTHSDNDLYKNEVYVEQYSDKIAKMNGRHGRLDMKPVLHPGDSLRVFDDKWVSDQIDQRMRKYDDSVKPKKEQPEDID
jgi:hypothetical protein